MSDSEAGSEGSPTSTDKQVEVNPKAGKVTMINGRKVGCVFPSKDERIQPGETYRVSEATAKQMEQIPGQRRA